MVADFCTFELEELVDKQARVASFQILLLRRAVAMSTPYLVTPQPRSTSMSVLWSREPEYELAFGSDSLVLTECFPRYITSS
jgi:hypothetical protein